MHIGFEMLAKAANETYLPLTTSERRVHGFASRSSASPFLRVFLLNKLEAAATVRIRLRPLGAPLTEAQAMVDTADHWGELRSLQVSCAGGECECTLPAVSFVALSSAVEDVLDGA